MKKLLALISAALFLPLIANAAITIDNNTSGQDISTGNNATAAATLTTTQANEVVVAVVANGSAGTSSTIAGGGLTWSAVPNTNEDITHGHASIFYAVAASTISAQTITATFHCPSLCSTGGSIINVYSLKGADTSNPLGASTSTNTTGTTVQPTIKITTTRAGSFVFGGFDDFDHATAFVANSTDTIDKQLDNTTQDTEISMRTTNAVTSTATSVTLGFTNAASTDHTNFIAAEILATSTQAGSSTAPIPYTEVVAFDW